MWYPEDRVQVALPYGDDGCTILLGTVVRVQSPGPKGDQPNATVKVRFDDPLVYGGQGFGWFDPLALAAPGDPAPRPVR